MLGPLAFLCALLFPSGHAEIRLEQPAVVVARESGSASLLCTAKTKVNYIHWYRHQEGKAPQRLLRRAMYQSDVWWDTVEKADKVTATEAKDGTSCTLSVLKLEKSDEGVYYCAAWETSILSWIKVFAQGTKLIVTPPDRNLDADTSPKPTIFFPSIAEIKFHKVGTYLCLLENFFPEVIKIDWQEKDGKRILTSWQGDTMKTNDTYMKFSWLTVTKKSIAKEHKCIVTHTSNKGGVNEEILFRSMKKELAAIDPEKIEDDILQLQLGTTSAYYTYLLLFFKTLVYSAIIAFYLFGGPALCGNEKSS